MALGAVFLRTLPFVQEMYQFSVRSRIALVIVNEPPRSAGLKDLHLAR
jgi:hypothetical protein